MDTILANIIRSTPTSPKPDKLTSELIIGYATQNFNRFLRMSHAYYNTPERDRDNCGIRIEEVQNYITIWQKVTIAWGSWDKLDKFGKNEVLDAFYDEFGYEDEDWYKDEVT